ncbi:hypothetical protein CDD81_5829 [Ophiocordyceps australis]|uniref:Kynurenine formamidase n=1 Tax=Ophiocordyceps australis TaxID=1399860 RepID=A0A2C5Y7N5_9HYPO|nr:hypothetical protein CDD81_5829 [Ophiocordyceps australis]
MASFHLPGLKDTLCHYGPHANQQIAIWKPDATPNQGAQTRQFWIVYIHGGAWRDPRRKCQDFAPAVKLLATSHHAAAICGYASIDYRLSSSDKFPQDPAHTPSSELRSAQHPDHVRDIYAAIKFLVAEHGLTRDYILIGHSAGATLAFQLVMGAAALQGHDVPDEVPLPAAIIGLAGIYDLVGLGLRRGPEYMSFLRAAFGPDEDQWRRASPALFPGSFKLQWPGATHALLAWSNQDPLIDVAEIDAMATKLKADDCDVAVNLDMAGDHDQMWRDGSQIAPLVAQVITREQVSQ